MKGTVIKTYIDTKNDQTDMLLYYKSRNTFAFIEMAILVISYIVNSQEGMMF